MEDAESIAKKPRFSSGFPADFFSDPSRIVPIVGNGSDDEEEEKQQPAAAPVASTPLDLEWERFQREVVNAPDANETKKEAYENATVFAEPVLASEIPEGFPAPETQSDRRSRSKRQKELDDRELIMDRLLEEERAQEEADMKVVSMKNRLDLLRQKREAAKAAKASSVPA
ncbi:hypothetical protein BT96DRAFT_917410 [Gymnopus androsaceus JB14]|uniref:Uncharacterized protein n=1 Tax=Gymnopus androsaceus JB14 TaxID=1447944 RepID=A0A6A4I109_9AGAR|nr:hypothetical protein BT96DRAFT_917410 [Gymnopus androsaceus JB14]